MALQPPSVQPGAERRRDGLEGDAEGLDAQPLLRDDERSDARGAVAVQGVSGGAATAAGDRSPFFID